MSIGDEQQLEQVGKRDLYNSAWFRLFSILDPLNESALNRKKKHESNKHKDTQ